MWLYSKCKESSNKEKMYDIKFPVLDWATRKIEINSYFPFTCQTFLFDHNVLCTWHCLICCVNDVVIIEILFLLYVINRKSVVSDYII